MNELTLIDEYFAGRLSEPERQQFEQSLQTDPALADAVAFYLLARQTAHTEARDRRRSELDALRTEKAIPVRRLPNWTYGAAAACLALLLGLGWYFSRIAAGPSAVELADQYIQTNLDQLSVTMDGEADRLQTGLNFYNNRAFLAADSVFTALLQRDPQNENALKFAGIVSLRLGKYDQAIDQFHRLGQRTDLYANPGVFLEAVARLKRGQPMDKNTAKDLLQSVIQRNLENKAEAQRILEGL